VTPPYHDNEARLFQALASPVRVRILELLSASSSMSVTEIHQRLQISPANASQHLSILRDRGLVSRRREGVTIWYSLSDQGVADLLREARAIAERQATTGMRLLELPSP
jgi:DNA-binding transcriptional ArsR family regulator